MRTFSLIMLALFGAFLLVTGASAADSASLTISGIVIPAGGPVAEFASTPTSGLAPLTVQFADLSTGIPTSWYWDFGDGGTSTLQNPAYTYWYAGAYTVSLAVENGEGASVEAKPACIRVSYRLNCGAAETRYTDTSGDVWSIDQKFKGDWGWVTTSSTGQAIQPIGNTDDDPLYQDWRYRPGGPLLYSFKVKDGDFRVTMKFLEPDYDDDRRGFDVILEDIVVIPAYRPYIAAGGRYMADDSAATVTVMDSVLNLKLQPLGGANRPPGRNNPLIVAVEVDPAVT